MCPAVLAYLRAMGNFTDTPVPVLADVCVIGQPAFQAVITGCVGQFQAAAGSQAATIAGILNRPPASISGTSYFVLVQAAAGNGTQPRIPGNDQNGIGSDALMTINSAAGAYVDGLPRDVCASFIHELAHAVQINAGTLDNTPVPLETATPMPPYAGTGMMANLPRRELVAVTVENCWRASQIPPLALRQRYFYRAPLAIMGTLDILPDSVANPPTCTWPVTGVP